MRRSTMILAAMLCAAVAGTCAQSGARGAPTQRAGELRLVRTIKVAEFRYGACLAVDVKRNRLYAASRKSNELAVIDLNDGRVIHRIPSLAQPQEILYLPESDTIVISSGGHGRCLFYRGEDFSLVKSVDGKPGASFLGADADESAIMLGYGSSVCTIDRASGKIVANVDLGATSKAIALEGTGKRAYVTLPRNVEVAVIDRASGGVTARWLLPDVENSNRLALDEKHRRLFVSSDRPNRIIVLDTDGGSAVASIPIIQGCTYLAYDQNAQRIYAVCNGTIDVIAQVDADTYRLAERIPIGSMPIGCYAAAQQRLYIFAAASNGSDGELAIYDTATSAPASTQPSAPPSQR